MPAPDSATSAVVKPIIRIIRVAARRRLFFDATCNRICAKRFCRRRDNVAAATKAKTKDIEALCASKGMRMTEQRRVIARTLASAEDHPDVEELYRRCSAIDDRISISTVYRTVKLFEDAGIIERHDFRDGRAR